MNDFHEDMPFPFDEHSNMSIIISPVIDLIDLSFAGGCKSLAGSPGTGIERSIHFSLSFRRSSDPAVPQTR
jgi:hypothetical protein